MFVYSAAQTIPGPSECAVCFQEKRYLHSNVQSGNFLLYSKFIKKLNESKLIFRNRKYPPIMTEFNQVFNPKDMEFKV